MIEYLLSLIVYLPLVLLILTVGSYTWYQQNDRSNKRRTK